MSAPPVLARLEALLREQGGLMASLLPQGAVLVPTHNGTDPAQIAASGPRAQAHSEEYELLVEAIYRAICCTTAPPAWCARRRPTSAYWLAISYTHLALRAWWRLATWLLWRSLRT